MQSQSVATRITLNSRFVQSNATNIGKKSTGFVLSMPRSLVSGKNESVCLSLHEAKLPAKILINLKWKGNHYPTLKTIQSGNQTPWQPVPCAIDFGLPDSTCFKLSVPLKKLLEPQFVSIRVQVQINRQVYTAHNQDPILVHPVSHRRVFVETDRGIYKPGDTVKILILRLDRNMRPLTQNVRPKHAKQTQMVLGTSYFNPAQDRIFLGRLCGAQISHADPMRVAPKTLYFNNLPSTFFSFIHTSFQQ